MQYPVKQVIANVTKNVQRLRTQADQQHENDVADYRKMVADLTASTPALVRELNKAARLLKGGQFNEARRVAGKVESRIPWQARDTEPAESTEVRRLRARADAAERLLPLLESARDSHVSSAELERLGLIPFLRV